MVYMWNIINVKRVQFFFLTLYTRQATETQFQYQPLSILMHFFICTPKKKLCSQHWLSVCDDRVFMIALKCLSAAQCVTEMHPGGGNLALSPLKNLRLPFTGCLPCFHIPAAIHDGQRNAATSCLISL